MLVCNHRKRVIMSLQHQEPDRVPLDLMGHACMLLDGCYSRLRDHLGLSPISPVRSGTTANYYDERILEYFDIDFRRLFMKTKARGRPIVHEDGTFTDPWGVRFRKTGLFVNPIEHPLNHARTVEDIEVYPWPKAEEMFTTKGLAREAERLYEETDYALVARNPMSLGFLDRACHLMGTAEFFMAMALTPEVAARIIAHLVDIFKDVYGMFLNAVGPFVQMFEVGDDLGSQTNTLVSPEMYRKFIKPAETELYALMHEKAPKAYLFRHTDGAIFPLIPDLIEVGVNVLNPVQTSAKGMDAQRLKQTYGKSITFHGTVEHLEGDVAVDDVVAEVKNRIDVFAPGGGYILSTCNHLINVRPEVITAMFKTAHDYGRYR